MCRIMYAVVVVVALPGFVFGCGGSTGETEADRIGVGAECNSSAQCESADPDVELDCLTQFKGGYCGLAGCGGDVDCPEGSACVTSEDGEDYCFRLCLDKPDCNLRRSPENESNCVGSITFVDPRNDRKACEPPSSGL